MAIPPLDSTEVDAYDEVRRVVQTGDLVMCSGNYLISLLIRFLTWSAWSHVAMVVRQEDIDRVMVLQCTILAGVNAVPLSSFVEHSSNPKKPYKGQVVIVRHADVADALKTKRIVFYQVALDLFGRSFDIREMGAILMRLIFFGPLFGKLHKRSIVRNKKYICSEYVDECYRVLDTQPPNDGVGFVAPVHFANDPKVSLVARLK